MPFGFPSGDGLKAALAASLQATGTIRGGHCDGLELVRLLGVQGVPAADCAAFGKALQRAPQGSIDAFLEHHPRYRDLGRMAIALAIAHCEAKGMEAIESSGSGDWLQFMFNRLGNPAGWRRDRLTILSYNYDRSFEAWLEGACRNGFGMSPESARAAVGALGTVHVHGSLGPVESFGTPADELPLAEVAPSLSMVFEEVEDSDAYKRAKRAVLSADLVGFLGFGYHRENVERLRIFEQWPGGSMGDRLSHAPPKKKELFGTAYEVPPADIEQIREAFEVDIQLSDPGVKALGFMEQSVFLGRLRHVIGSGA